MTSLSDQLLLANLATSVRVLTQIVAAAVHDKPALLALASEEAASQTTYWNEYRETAAQEHADFMKL